MFQNPAILKYARLQLGEGDLSSTTHFFHLENVYAISPEDFPEVAYKAKIKNKLTYTLLTQSIKKTPQSIK